MELGEKLRQARLEAGLSQRQLCGEEITRNMLSLIEHGTAKPSMKTLQYLSSRLGKSVSYFLEETAVLSPNQGVMEEARRYYDLAQYALADTALEGYRSPDPVYDREKALLEALIRLELGRQAMEGGRLRYALELLTSPVACPYCREALERQRLLLLGNLPGQAVSGSLPSLDPELLLRAREALDTGDPNRGAHLLEAMEARDSARWHLLRGESLLQQKQWEDAAFHLMAAEASFPEETQPKLEVCFREQGDFQKAYLYACKQRK